MSSHPQQTPPPPRAQLPAWAWWLIGGGGALAIIGLGIAAVVVFSPEQPVVVTAEEIDAMFRPDDMAGSNDAMQRRFRDRAVVVTGVVRQWDSPRWGQVVSLGPRDGKAGGALCYFRNQPPLNLKMGERVTVRGRCVGTQTLLLVLDNCEQVR